MTIQDGSSSGVETEQAPQPPAKPVAAAKSRAPANPVRRWTLTILAFCVIIFVYTLFSDRLAPYTPQAVVQAYIVGVAPEVAGRIVEVNVVDNEQVKAGQLLFRIDRESYEIAVRQAEARLATAGQNIGASTAGVSAAEAKLAEAIAERENTREQAARVLTLVKKGIYAKAREDQANAQVKSAEAVVQKAEADLEAARQSLGPEGADNPQIRDALAALQQAQLNLVRTDVFAPADGLVTNLQITVGQYGSPGQSLLTFIDVGDVWINADFRENSLGLISPGAPAEVVLDVLPGQVFPATVESIGWGVARSGQADAGDLPTVRNQSGWIRDPQRFTVRLTLATDKLPAGVRYNSQANVIVYADENSITGAIGRLWIRLVSILTYVI